MNYENHRNHQSDSQFPTRLRPRGNTHLLPADAEADSAEIENTDRIVKMQSEHIGRLDQRVEKLEEKVDKLEIIIEQKDTQIEQKQCIIRQAYKCKTPNEECPVLIKRKELERQQKDKSKTGNV